MLTALLIPSLKKLIVLINKLWGRGRPSNYTNGIVGHPEYLLREVYQQKQTEMRETISLYIQTSAA